MAVGLDLKQIVSFEELLISHVSSGRPSPVAGRETDIYQRIVFEDGEGGG